MIVWIDDFTYFDTEGVVLAEGKVEGIKSVFIGDKEIDMGIKLTKKAEAVETKEIKEKQQVISEDTKTEELELPKEIADSGGGAGCEVGVDMSYTENLGNYRSARVGVSLKVTVAHHEIDEAFVYAKEWVDQRMQVLVAEVQELKAD